jgi:hypothetical protein
MARGDHADLANIRQETDARPAPNACVSSLKHITEQAAFLYAAGGPVYPPRRVGKLIEEQRKVQAINPDKRAIIARKFGRTFGDDARVRSVRHRREAGVRPLATAARWDLPVAWQLVHAQDGATWHRLAELREDA